MQQSLPSFGVFKDFLQPEIHQVLLDYVSLDHSYQRSNDPLSQLRFEDIPHSKDESLRYLRPYVSVDGSVHESDFAVNDEDWVYLRHYPTDEKIVEIIKKLDIMTSSSIQEIYKTNVKSVYDIFFLRYSDGRGLRLHNDTYEINNNYGSNVNTGYFSSVYYINDNYSGGINNSPYSGVSFKPLANTLYLTYNIWDEDMIHEVTAVTTGERYTRQQIWELDSTA